MTETSVQSLPTSAQEPGLREAWQMVLGRLRPEMSKALFETWVEPLRPLSYREGVVTIGAANPYGRDWVESRLKSSLSRLLEGVYNTPLERAGGGGQRFCPAANPRQAASAGSGSRRRNGEPENGARERPGRTSRPRNLHRAR